MGTKGTKASNIYQVLKGAGAWQSKDSQGPMIKGVGIKSPLNMKASPAKIMPSPSVEKKIDKKEPVKKTSYSEAYKKRDMKTYGNLTEAEYTAEAKRQNKSKKETGKWDAPKKQMESKENKTTDPKTTTTDPKTTDPKTTTTDPKKENVVKNTRKEVAAANKKKRQDRRAARRQKRADRIKETGGTRVGNLLRKGKAKVEKLVEKKDKKEESPAKLYKKKASPAKLGTKKGKNMTAKELRDLKAKEAANIKKQKEASKSNPQFGKEEYKKMYGKYPTHEYGKRIKPRKNK